MIACAQEEQKGKIVEDGGPMKGLSSNSDKNRHR